MSGYSPGTSSTPANKRYRVPDDGDDEDEHEADDEEVETDDEEEDAKVRSSFAKSHTKEKLS